jgi:hypothetical protein
MELRAAARAEVLANFTPVSELTLSPQPVDMWGQRIDPRETDEDEAYRLLMPLNMLAGLIERMGLEGHTVPTHRPACEDLLARLLASCRSAAVRRGLLDAVRGVGAGEYDTALASLRAIAA